MITVKLSMQKIALNEKTVWSGRWRLKVGIPPLWLKYKAAVSSKVRVFLFCFLVFLQKCVLLFDLHKNKLEQRIEEVRIHCDISMGCKVAIRRLTALLRLPQVVRPRDKEKRGPKIRGNSEWLSGLDNDRHYCVGHGKLWSLLLANCR